MYKVLLGFLIALLVSGNVLTVALLLRGGPGARAPAGEHVSLLRVEEAIATLSEKVSLLAASSPAAPPLLDDSKPASRAGSSDDVLARLAGIESLLTRKIDTDDELAAARLREEREDRFLSEDGFIAADELLSQKQFALAGNGYLKFLERYPDHPDARDLMAKACDTFLRAGYNDKAFAIHQEMMSRFPDNRDKDLMTLAIMEKDAGRLDGAIQHATEAAELARVQEEKVWRLMYRAWFVQLRDGDAAGLQAYREVEQLIEQLSLGDANPGKKVKAKIAEVEAKLALGR